MALHHIKWKSIIKRRLSLCSKKLVLQMKCHINLLLNDSNSTFGYCTDNNYITYFYLFFLNEEMLLHSQKIFLHGKFTANSTAGIYFFSINEYPFSFLSFQETKYP